MKLLKNAHTLNNLKVTHGGTMVYRVALQTAPLNVCKIRLAVQSLRALHLNIPYQVWDKLLNSVPTTIFQQYIDT
jgi:hypothetical protein